MFRRWSWTTSRCSCSTSSASTGATCGRSRRTGFEGFTLPARDEIERRVRWLRWVDRTGRRAAEVGRALGRPSGRCSSAEPDAPWAVSAATLRVSSGVLIVSDGILHLLPFSALPDPRTIASDTQVADPLIVEHELTDLPSASTLALLRRNWHQDSGWPRTARVFADPIFLKPMTREFTAADARRPSRLACDQGRTCRLAEAGIARCRRIW